MAEAPTAGRALRAASPRPWNDPRVRAVFFQLLAIALLGLLVWYLVSNTVANIRARNIQTGFDFLWSGYGSQIDESLIGWDPASTYGRAFLVGLLNTLKVGVVGIVLATVLGTVIGIARLSSNWLLAKLASVYVETVRNIPLLLQLAFFATLFSAVLPPQLQPAVLGGVFILSKSGFIFPQLVIETAHVIAFAMLVPSIGAAIGYNRWAKQRQAATGRAPSRLLPSLAIIFLPAILTWLMLGAPAEFEVAKRGRFRMEGGGVISTEFLAILCGLTIYTAGFIAEIVRSGILAVSYGQTEAAGALGLSRGQALRLVILPQAMRVVIPPMTSQFLNLIKNSSLGVAIGYPEIVAIANISINQAGRAIECILIIMVVYLSISLSIAAFMNWYNKRVALVER
jgi:general L-amino acid transport system permease protein